MAESDGLDVGTLFYVTTTAGVLWDISHSVRLRGELGAGTRSGIARLGVQYHF